MKINQLLVCALALLSSLSCTKDGEDEISTETCQNSSTVFSIALIGSDCTEDVQAELGINSVYSESVTGSMRDVTINGIANHLVGDFPNAGNPNSIAAVSENYSMTTNPQLASQTTIGRGFAMGVLFSGVGIETYTGEFFEGTSGTNRDWNITALQNTRDLGLDCNNAHVQPTGRYHYHGVPANYGQQLGADGTAMVKIGYAADGFPIYYRYGYATDGLTIIDLQSGYRLKTEARGGDGIDAPDGCPDGYYFSDYEYVEGISLLDECNGRMGKTPESANEYYYIITSNFPSSPLCFSGTPDASFRIF